MRRPRGIGGVEILFAWLIQWMLVFCALRMLACSDGMVEASGGRTSLESNVGCTVSTVRHPTSENEFARLYSGRSFLVDNVHIGYDVQLVEGTPIYPMACGTVRIYRAAQGYGTLVVVIEHHLSTPITVRNGLGVEVSIQNFLSIYGHLRRTSSRIGGTALNWHDGDSVRPDQVIGYVQNAADNGDGGEHLHFGIRLQSATDAQATEPAAWFAGYDTTNGSRRRWYADPVLFVSALLNRSTRVATATWHPPGTVLSVNGRTWFVTGDGTIAPVATSWVRNERLDRSLVLSTESEIACMMQAGLSLAQTSGHRLMRFNDTSTVYEYADAPLPIRYSFLAQAAFDSWGWNGAQVEMRNASERSAFLAGYRDLGSRRLREGSLVKASGQSAVYVVTAGQHRPIFNEATFFALGYDFAEVIEVDSSVLDALAGPLGSMIRMEDATRCVAAPQSTAPSTMDAGMSSPQDAGSGLMIDAGGERVLPMVDVSTGLLDIQPSSIIDRPSAQADVAASRDTSVSVDLIADRAMVELVDVGTICDAPPLGDVGSVSSVDTSVQSSPIDVPLVSVEPTSTDAVMRYEFRLAQDVEGWSPVEPYRLRDQYWVPVLCLNAVGLDLMRMMSVGQGWYRCDTATRLSMFVGTFFSPTHPTEGDRGNIGTIGNWPGRCSPRPGVEWRIQDLTSGREVYHGPASGLTCAHVDTQDRHALP